MRYVLFVLVLCAVAQFKGQTADADAYSTLNFDSKIDAWAEGTLMSIDADGAKFSVRGTRREYATAYAGMLKDIQAKTKDLPATEHAAKAAEVRTKWQPDLDAARNKPAGKEGD